MQPEDQQLSVASAKARKTVLSLVNQARWKVDVVHVAPNFWKERIEFCLLLEVVRGSTSHATGCSDTDTIAFEIGDRL
jgi:hypothetical protein